MFGYNPVAKPNHKRSKPKRKEITRIRPETAEHVWEREQGRCLRCKRQPPEVWTLELAHIINRSQGGPGEPWNVILLCGPSTNYDTCHFFIDSTRAGKEWAKRYQEEVLNPLYGREKNVDLR
jgi:5-methylcytosine-specific restriction endonuclease McrA